MPGITGSRGDTLMSVKRGAEPTILTQKHYSALSAFTPENLLREARHQKRMADASVPVICILDPDCDIMRALVGKGQARLDPAWACYHTQLYSFIHAGMQFGIFGCAVGTLFAVLIEEELFASGCELLISMMSTGQIVPVRLPPYFIIIDIALYDEGTSYHYLAPSVYSYTDKAIIRALEGAFDNFAVPVLTGATWTTDAPFGETQQAIDAMREKELLAFEREAAALYAFVQARRKPVLCFAYVTNQMGRIDGDFEKGEADGSKEALNLIEIAARRFRFRTSP
jgi:uridine phosphorylase